MIDITEVQVDSKADLDKADEYDSATQVIWRPLGVHGFLERLKLCSEELLRVIDLHMRDVGVMLFRRTCHFVPSVTQLIVFGRPSNDLWHRISLAPEFLTRVAR